MTTVAPICNCKNHTECKYASVRKYGGKIFEICRDTDDSTTPAERAQYRSTWEKVEGHPPPSQKHIVNSAPQRPPGPIGVGPGTELKKLLSRIKIYPKANCKCNSRMNLMDQEGANWCRLNTETIVGWLKEEANRRRLPFTKFAGRLLVKRAIRNSERV